MNFDKLANTISESYSVASEETEARPPNPEFLAWKNTQSPEFISTLKNPYSYWYLKVRGKGPDVAGTETPPIAPTTPSAVSSSKEYGRTQEVVDEIVTGNPNATVEDVLAALEPRMQVSGPLGFKYVTDTQALQQMLDTAKGIETGGSAEPGEGDINDDKAAKLARLRKFMGMGRGERDLYLKKAKAAAAAKVADFNTKDKEEDGEDEEDIDPDVKRYVSQLKGGDEDEGSEDYEKD